MKKTALLSFMLVMAMSYHAQAQSPYLYGIKLGVNYANIINNSMFINTSPLPGFNIGVPFELNVSQRVAFQPEINFIQKGYQVIDKSQSLVSYAISKYRINYLEIPFLFKAKFGAKKLKLTFLTGPNISYAIGGSYKFFNVNDTAITATTYFNEIKTNIDRVNFS